jgi:hypothetical protein
MEHYTITLFLCSRMTLRSSQFARAALITDERRYASLLAGRQVYVVHHGLRRGTMVGPTCGWGPTTVPVRKNYVPVRSLGPRMVCSQCGYIGADVRPDWSPHVNKRHA